MMERRQGKIINVGSIGGRVPTFPFYFGYSVAKAALIHMSAVLAEALEEYRICVNAVGVSAATQTPQEARAILARLGTPLPAGSGSKAPPEDNVGLFLFLASSASDHVTGQYMEANSLPSEPRT
jgi:NAD(P)-dependent dehydrogenase (short-subunit alcohol dehydrogenase family)